MHRRPTVATLSWPGYGKSAMVPCLYDDVKYLNPLYCVSSLYFFDVVSRHSFVNHYNVKSNVRA